MGEFEKFALGILGGLVGGLIVSRQNHYFALVRDEWNAGRRIRTLLNAFLEKHRYSHKRGEPKEFFQFANEAHDADDPHVNQLDDAVNEFKDFLTTNDKTEFEKIWHQVRHEIRRMKNRVASPTAAAQEEMRLCFNQVEPLLNELKRMALKLRETPWYSRMFWMSKLCSWNRQESIW